MAAFWMSLITLCFISIVVMIVTLTSISHHAFFCHVYMLYTTLLRSYSMLLGYPQSTSTEALKSCVHNEAIAVTTSLLSPANLLAKMQGKMKDSAASNMPVMMNFSGSGNKQKNEIFVDILERLTVLFNSSGYIVNSAIDGTILMKSFLSGNPELRLALNEDLVVGKNNVSQGGSVVLDDCNFHERVYLDEFDTSRTLHFYPPDGEFAVLNYRITSEFRPPFRIFPVVEEVASNEFKLDFICESY